MPLVSRKGLLAIAAVIDVAIHANGRPVSAKSLAARHKLPPRHLEPVLQALVRDGILKGVRGPHGGYELARVGVAISDTVDGNYQYLKSFRPLDHESRDIGQFIDDDGTAYLIFEDRPNGFHIAKLSDDYLTVEKDMCLIPEHLEGGALVHYHGLYYVVGSHLTGWGANPNVYATAKSLSGPWSEFKDIAPPEKKTYGSQSSMLIKVTGTQTTSVIYVGDIWRPRTQWDSRYLWMPLQIGDGKLSLPEPAEWSLDVQTGVATVK